MSTASSPTVSPSIGLFGFFTNRRINTKIMIGFAVVLAVISLIAGIVVLLRPGTGIVAVVIILGVFLVVSGVIQLAGAVSEDLPLLTAALALVDLVLGIVILVVPDIGLITLALLFGLSLVARGAVAIGTGLRLRRLGSPVRGGGRLATES